MNPLRNSKQSSEHLAPPAEGPLFQPGPVSRLLASVMLMFGLANKQRYKKKHWTSYAEYLQFKLTKYRKKLFSSSEEYAAFKHSAAAMIADRGTRRQNALEIGQELKQGQESEHVQESELRLRQTLFAVQNSIKSSGHKQKLGFKHSGNAGDIIYSLPIVKALAAGRPSSLYLQLDQPADYTGRVHPLGNVRLNEAMALGLLPLLRTHPCLHEVEIYSGQTIDFDLDHFRDLPIITDRGHIARWYFWVYGVSGDLSVPWLQVQNPDPPANVIVLARSQRYRNPGLDFRFLNQMGEIRFVGTRAEYNEMLQILPRLVYAECIDFLQLARVIKSSRFFIGNQSFPYSIAEALKVPRVLEVCRHCPNVVPDGAHGYEAYFQFNFERIVEQLMKATEHGVSLPIQRPQI